MRHSLLIRLVAVSVLVAFGAITATAWLAVHTTTGAIEQEQSVVLADGAQIYRTLLKYAATHPQWTDVDPVVRSLADRTGRRIALLTPNRATLADSSGGSAPLPRKASALIDPLAVDPTLMQSAPADRIAPDAVGPFRLPAQEKQRLGVMSQRVLKCVRTATGAGSIVNYPDGHPHVRNTGLRAAEYCGEDSLNQPTASERAALTALGGLVNDCLERQHLPAVTLSLDLSWNQTASAPAPALGPEPVKTCLTASRREQLSAYVSPAALLFVTTDSGAAPSQFDLSRSNEIRIAYVTGAVLLLTVVVTVLAGGRMVRPLRALTHAARRASDGEIGARVDVRGNDEVARLGRAFNDMSASRERTEELRTVMVGDIAHELRTPLSNIRGWLEATVDGVSRPDQPLMASLLEEALLLQRVIDDLQDLAMADAGKLPLHLERINAATIVEQVQVMYAPRVTAHVEDDLELVTDPVRFRQILSNLVANSVRHTPESGTITVTAVQKSTEVVVQVTDTGSGINPEDLPHIFDRFWRAEKSRSRDTGGSGLGLAIVRKLVEALGGDVKAESTLGVGSTFTIRLPAREM